MEDIYKNDLNKNKEKVKLVKELIAKFNNVEEKKIAGPLYDLAYYLLKEIKDDEYLPEGLKDTVCALIDEFEAR